MTSPVVRSHVGVWSRRGALTPAVLLGGRAPASSHFVAAWLRIRSSKRLPVNRSRYISRVVPSSEKKPPQGYTAREPLCFDCNMLFCLSQSHIAQMRLPRARLTPELRAEPPAEPRLRHVGQRWRVGPPTAPSAPLHGATRGRCGRNRACALPSDLTTSSPQPAAGRLSPRARMATPASVPPRARLHTVARLTPLRGLAQFCGTRSTLMLRSEGSIPHKSEKAHRIA